MSTPDHNEQTPTPFDVLVEEMKQEAHEAYKMEAGNFYPGAPVVSAYQLDDIITHTAHAVREATQKEERINQAIKQREGNFGYEVHFAYLANNKEEAERVKVQMKEAFMNLATLSTKDTPTT